MCPPFRPIPAVHPALCAGGLASAIRESTHPIRNGERRAAGWRETVEPTWTSALRSHVFTNILQQSTIPKPCDDLVDRRKTRIAIERAPQLQEKVGSTRRFCAQAPI